MQRLFIVLHCKNLILFYLVILLVPQELLRSKKVDVRIIFELGFIKSCAEPESLRHLHHRQLYFFGALLLFPLLRQKLTLHQIGFDIVII